MSKSALELIIEWTKKDLHEWQSDAVRRLLTQNKITSTDEKEILKLLKAKHDLLGQNEPVIAVMPLERGYVSGAPKVIENITLKNMANLENVNALPDGSELPFGHSGLTVIYGENATGKSGYARVLKKACGARDTKERILPNVFEESFPSHAKASFKISVNSGTDKIIDWEDGTNSPDILTNISVFDTKCGRVIIDENNEASYLPYGAYIFEDLVSLMKRLREQLQKEKPQIEELEYPEAPATTKAGQFLKVLTRETSIEEIEKVASWSQNDKKKLLKIHKLIADIQTDDLQKQVARLRNLCERTKQFTDIFDGNERVISAEKEKILKGLINELNIAENALTVVSGESLASEPLSGVGEDTWRVLYEAAREYSLKKAYIGKDFPYIGKDSRCVLCMQLLSEEAKERLKRFNAYMEEESKKTAEKTAIKINDFLEEIKGIDELLLESYKDVVHEIHIRNDEVAEETKGFYSVVIKRARGMIQGAENKNSKFILPQIIPSPLKKMKAIVSDLESEIIKIEKAAEPEKIKELENERAELEAKRCLTSKKTELIKYVENLKITHQYDNCIRETEFTAITLKGKKIISEALTPELKSALQKELYELRATHLPLNLKTFGIEGETSHKMQLNGIQFPERVNLTDILSEGEQHVVAIAGFLAELSIGKHECPIIFDDPVCSLDHIYREKIAERLVKEATQRQVIIFTHDIAFLLELDAKAKETEDILLFTQSISKDVDKLGKPEKTLPWHIMSVNKRINYLEERLAKFQSLYRKNMKEYNEKAGSLYGMLRETWEAAVEEVLFDKTIIRFGGKVQTLRLKSVEVTDEDYREIYLGMEKCSTWMLGHDRAKPIDENRPDPNEIRDDINKIKGFVARIKKRKKKKEQERELIFKTQEPDVG
jgi:hypothetical protein